MLGIQGWRKSHFEEIIFRALVEYGFGSGVTGPRALIAGNDAFLGRAQNGWSLSSEEGIPLEATYDGM